jgi:hypothetical protein
LGYATGRTVGACVPGAVIGGVSGAINGWRRIYDWQSPSGVAGFALDHSWALATTLGGLVSHALSALRGQPGFEPAVSERRGRHVYARGFQVRRGFAMAMGNVVTGVGDRHRLVDDHEMVHVWQSRLLGPLYPVAYVGWSVMAAPVGVWQWWRNGRQRPLGRVVDAVAYRANPLERWAYAHQARRAAVATASAESPVTPG